MNKQITLIAFIFLSIFPTQTFFAAESCNKEQQAICIACCSSFITTAACSTCAISTGIVDPSFLLCCGIGCASSYLITSKINCSRSGFTKATAQPLMEIIIGDAQAQETSQQRRRILPPQQQTMLPNFSNIEDHFALIHKIQTIYPVMPSILDTLGAANYRKSNGFAKNIKQTRLLGIPKED